ncbi:MAG TPA: DUF6036 family nucleotidyltransferase [Verrucomicrobiae bacterium]|nr:DUF6036 family nucleotidyltransferase [Verrucomicrobiae bacterium]
MDFLAANIDWQCPAGRRLDELASGLPANPRLDLVVFGSTPLQLFIEPALLSADIDLFASDELLSRLIDFVDQQGWTREKSPDLYIQVCDPLAFKSTVDWSSRVIKAERHGHFFHFVHPWDVLVSKLQRLEEKDLNAFRVVIEKTGHPTEDEFALHLQLAVDLYRPSFDEESSRGDMLMNTKILWQIQWGTDIDVRARIIRPALQRTEAQYDRIDASLKTRLGNLRLPGQSANNY